MSFLFLESRFLEGWARAWGVQTPELQQEQAEKSADIARKLDAAGGGIHEFGKGVGAMRDQFLKEWSEKFPAGTTTPQTMPTPSAETSPQAALSNYLRGTLVTKDQDAATILDRIDKNLQRVLSIA